MRSTNSTVVWIAALGTSTLGAAILFSAEAGINWPIWVAAASVSVIVARYVSAKRVEAPLLILLAWATILSVRFALSDTPFIRALIVLSDAMLLGLAMITLGVVNWSELSAKLLVAVPVLAPVRVIGGTAYEATATPRSFSSSRTRSVAIGAVLSAAVIVVLIALLGSADPVISWITEHLAGWLPDWSFPPRVLFFAFLLVLTLGANSIASRQIQPNIPRYPQLEARPALGVTEQRMMLWSSAVVLWLFVLLQASYLVHSPPAALGSGVTFAEFARRGFGQLSFAATLVGAIILILEYARPGTATERERTTLRHLELALIIAVELVLISAFRRVILYEQAYGFTTARLVAQAYMIAMGLALVALALEIRRERISIAFGRRVAEIALGVFTVLTLWNFEGWIAARNIDRAQTTGKFDALYASRLSSDAIPTLARRHADIPQPARDSVELRFACKQLRTERRWFEWNRSVNAAADALRTWQRPPCPVPSVRASQAGPVSP
ncbi:MAG: DUF4153 domain-containing protein [Gemmatimonadaceae bacterium]